MAATPATLKNTFQAFGSVADPTLQYWIDRALRVVDWGDDHATYLLAAHYMVANGIGSGAEAEMAAAGASGFKSMRSGALSLDRGSSGDSGNPFEGTMYGRQFYPLLIANKGGSTLTGSGAPMGGYGYQDRPIWGC